MVEDLNFPNLESSFGADWRELWEIGSRGKGRREATSPSQEKAEFLVLFFHLQEMGIRGKGRQEATSPSRVNVEHQKFDSLEGIWTLRAQEKVLK